LIKNRSGSKDTLEYLRDSVNTIDNSHKQLLGQIGNLAHGYMDDAMALRDWGITLRCWVIYMV